MKTVKVCLGRFMPFTLGHLKLATYKNFKGPDEEQSSKLREQPDLKEIAKQKTIILAVSTPEEKRDTRHPFTDDIMKQEFDMIKKNYPEIEDVMYVKSADICAWGEMLKQKGYQASVWLTGSDEYKIYKMMAMKVPEYEEHNRNNYDCKGAYTPSFYVEEVKRAEGTDDFTESISGTKVRQALIDNNIEEFKKMMPKGADKFFDEFKQAVETAPEPVKKTTKRKVKEEYKLKGLKNYILERFISKTQEVKEDPETIHFWSQPVFKDGLVSFDEIKDEYKDAYYKAKHNVALIGETIANTFTIYFNKKADIYIELNMSGSKSWQQDIWNLYYRKKLKFELHTAAWCTDFRQGTQLLYKIYK